MRWQDAVPESGLDESEIDGRMKRRIDNRRRVVQAYLDLLADGDEHPGVDDVASRAGVSARSIFRYFDDLPRLARAALAEGIGRAIPLALVSNIGTGPLDDRIERLVDARLLAFESSRRFGRTAQGLTAGDPAMADAVERVRLLLRVQVERHFEPELSKLAPEQAARVVDAVALLTGFNAFETALNVHDFDADRIRAVWVYGLTRLLSPA